jgi:hypothetical protein
MNLRAVDDVNSVAATEHFSGWLAIPPPLAHPEIPDTILVSGERGYKWFATPVVKK